MQTFKKILLAAAVATIASAQLFAASPRRGFAVVIDARSYEEARRQVDDYAAEIGKSGLEVHFVIDRTGQPDSLRQVLRQLWEQPKAPIEGAVLIGDIPVVMVRDAQHLTSAFKMDQTAFDRWESSVPSDRFYDDFSLEFAPLGRDSIHPGCFYYSLTAESAQRTRPDIYSGRIRPTDCNGTSRYEKLRGYLEKAVEAKRNPEPVDQILFFSGNGFISESMVARIDEKATLFEHFPWLERQRNGISYIDHKRDAHIKPRLMNEMQRRDLDFAVLHHHGDWDTEYLNNLPMTNDTKQQIAQIKMYLRESMRHAISHDIPADSARARITPLRRVSRRMVRGRRRSGDPGGGLPLPLGSGSLPLGFRPLHARMPRRVARRLLQRLVPPRQQHRQRLHFQPGTHRRRASATWPNTPPIWNST